MYLKKLCGILLTAAALVVAACGKENEGNGKDEEKVPSKYNITGIVKDAYGTPLAGVVVTDGFQCAKSFKDGKYYLNADLTKAKYVYVSTPTGYLPPVSKGIPVFYKALSELSMINGEYYQYNFVLDKMDNPNDLTMFMTADPQPRSSTAGYDKLGYHSLDCCDLLYRDLRETAAKAGAGRQIVGFCLGDIVHENMSLFNNYCNNGLATLGYPTWNIIGNHDNNPRAADDDAGGADFESHFGPRWYSLNLAGIHCVVLDNLIMKKDANSGELTAYDQGLTDEIWDWLQADMKYVPRSSTVMVFAHSPMFMQSSGSNRGGKHVKDYGALFAKYAEVHAWAGHSHQTYNYIYPSSNTYKNIQVHTVARSTGELWTNDYLSNGTPRGFTIVEIRGGKVDSWRFHPTKYQPAWSGGSTKPTFKLAEWTYNSSNVAHLKFDETELDENYQMHLYAPGSYKSGDNLLYAHIFLYDDKWGEPRFQLEGSGAAVKMNRVSDKTRYDAGDTEMRTWYKTKNATLKAAEGYTASTTGYPSGLFSTRVTAATGIGTVTVTDRFGKTWSQKIKW